MPQVSMPYPLGRNWTLPWEGSTILMLDSLTPGRIFITSFLLKQQKSLQTKIVGFVCSISLVTITTRFDFFGGRSTFFFTLQIAPRNAPSWQDPPSENRIHREAPVTTLSGKEWRLWGNSRPLWDRKNNYIQTLWVYIMAIIRLGSPRSNYGQLGLS